MKVKAFLVLLFMGITGYEVCAQQKVGDKWMDNNLSFQVVAETIRDEGRLYICIIDTSREEFCIENLQTGFEIEVYDNSGTMIWEGIGSGRTNSLKLPRPMADASYIIIRAFKPFVLNKLTSTPIYQDERIETKYIIK